MKPSNSCYLIIKHFEGCKLEAYLCPSKIATIGFGNTYYPNGVAVKMGDKITLKQAEDMLPMVVEKFAKSVLELAKRPLLQCEFDALVSFAYNCGIGNLQKSTLLNKVNSKAGAKEIEAEFIKWNKGGGKVLEGLTRRRKSEAYLYNTGALKFNF